MLRSKDEPTTRSQHTIDRGRLGYLRILRRSAQYRSDEALSRTHFAHHALLPYLMISLVCRPGPARVKTTKMDRSTLKIRQ